MNQMLKIKIGASDPDVFFGQRGEYEVEFLCEECSNNLHTYYYKIINEDRLLIISDYSECSGIFEGWANSLTEFFGKRHPKRLLEIFKNYIKEHNLEFLKVNEMKIYPEKEYIFVDTGSFDYESLIFSCEIVEINEELSKEITNNYEIRIYNGKIFDCSNVKVIYEINHAIDLPDYYHAKFK